MSITAKETGKAGKANIEIWWSAALHRLFRPMHYSLLREFRQAAWNGDVNRVKSLLHPAVSVVVDSGGGEHQTIRVVTGAYDAVTLLLHGLAQQPGLSVLEHSVNGQAGLIATRGGEPTAVLAVDFVEHLISVVWIRLHPVVLRHGTTV